MSGISILVAYAAQEQEVIKRMREAGATSPAAAVAVRDEALQSALQRLLDHRMVREGDLPGRFYVDERALAAYDGSQRSEVVTFAVGVLVVLVVMVLGVGLAALFE